MRSDIAKRILLKTPLLTKLKIRLIIVKLLLINKHGNNK
jgi:hypothetical protein